MKIEQFIKMYELGKKMKMDYIVIYKYRMIGIDESNSYMSFIDHEYMEMSTPYVYNKNDMASFLKYCKMSMDDKNNDKRNEEIQNKLDELNNTYGIDLYYTKRYYYNIDEDNISISDINNISLTSDGVLFNNIDNTKSYDLVNKWISDMASETFYNYCIICNGYKPIYHNTNIREDPRFEKYTELKSSDGVFNYIISDLLLSMIIPIGALPINKSDTVELSVYPSNNNTVLSDFIIHKGKIDMHFVFKFRRI